MEKVQLQRSFLLMPKANTMKQEFRANSALLKPLTVKLPNLQPELKSVLLPLLPAQKLYENTIQIGAGNYWHALVAYRLQARRSEKRTYSFHAKYQNWQHGSVDDQNSGTNLLNLQGDAQWFMSKISLLTQAQYQRQKVYFFGYETNTSQPIERKIMQNAQLYWQADNHRTANMLAYQASALYQYWQHTTANTEHQISLKTRLRWQWQPKHNVVATPTVTMLWAKQQERLQARHLYQVHAYYHFVGKHSELKAGLVAALPDSANHVKQLPVFPFLLLKYAFWDNKAVWETQLNGGLQPQSLAQLHTENFWASANLRLAHTWQVWQLQTSLQWQTAKTWYWRVGAKLGQYQQLGFWVNAPNAQQTFELMYEPQKTQILHLYQLLSLKQKRLSVQFQTDYRRYDLPTLQVPFHQPLLTNHLHLTYQVAKWHLGIQIWHWGSIKTLQNQTVQSLPDIIDIAPRVQFRLKTQGYIWAEGNNLIGTPYQRFLHYPTRGRQLTVGLSWQF